MEDLGALLCSEQTLLDALAVFLGSLSTSERGSLDGGKITKIVTNLLKHKYSLQLKRVMQLVSIASGSQ